jgi:hypothetical protein
MGNLSFGPNSDSYQDTIRIVKAGFELDPPYSAYNDRIHPALRSSSAELDLILIKKWLKQQMEPLFPHSIHAALIHTWFCYRRHFYGKCFQPPRRTTKDNDGTWPFIHQIAKQNPDLEHQGLSFERDLSLHFDVTIDFKSERLPQFPLEQLVHPLRACILLLPEAKQHTLLYLLRFLRCVSHRNNNAQTATSEDQQRQTQTPGPVRFGRYEILSDWETQYASEYFSIAGWIAWSLVGPDFASSLWEWCKVDVMAGQSTFPNPRNVAVTVIWLMLLFHDSIAMRSCRIE